ncbi:prepilin peptidase [Listeria welshimeri]|uniref:prepilin peptidase n=1 Tax=Listeria welshimeri TaxID=1643 RepID=UPI0010BC297F|nr:A24 family peptidase [Listeria welshimeri]MBC1320513.1 prepilin peptidase [Listeria welshimeri]MBC1411979.1 prepilin peptidase [Listeria welshimeri]MBC2289367.1 prepilin peptidase [Listeria welshimeri]MBC2363006.1 prepilin peptidase [Listeria welshimeri]MBS9361160.1 prepilin peptidase [Listeria welshimeri]
MVPFLIIIYSAIIISFIQVAAECFPIKKPFLFRFSECNYCKKTLTFLQIIPVFSFLFLKGKSKCCKVSIPFTYFLLEIITPCYMVFLYVEFSFSQHFFIYCSIYYFLAFFLITDILYMYVPNAIMFLFFSTLLLFYLLFQLPFLTLIYSIILSSFFYLLFYLLFRKGIGLGDIKIFIVLSSFLGFKMGYFIFFSAILLGTFSLLTALALKKIKKDNQVPFVPYIFTSFILISILIT